MEKVNQKHLTLEDRNFIERDFPVEKNMYVVRIAIRYVLNVVDAISIVQNLKKIYVIH